ncbi:hypothetical protein TSAR_002539 [Trichomalopsis sarcophagae]|uniref:Uncharacterized protein n=1 Tax=Trichomalopsis sarcophagae TaxID=543379 RepID=A0A232ET93_9HYME|nr:hypothetical protein TSAR_002539 [Trichomalopsis sarcophagae]
MPSSKHALPHARTMEATSEEIDVESLDEDEEMPPLRLSSSSSSSSDENSDFPASTSPIVSVDRDVVGEESLATLKISLLDEPLPQHKIETMAGTRVLTRKQYRAFEKIIPMKRGRFSINEDVRLSKNWRNFCTVHNWSPKNISPFLRMRSENGTYLIPALEERRKFVQFLAKDMKNRSLYSVYSRFRKMHNQPENSGQYTKREDDTILRNLSLGTSACSTLAKQLKRDKLSIRHRMKVLQAKMSNSANLL